MRTLVLALAAATAALASPAFGAEVSLRNELVSHGARITLGDLFDGAGSAASVGVAAAPTPGQQAVLDAGAIQGAAKRAGLDWANAEGRRRLIVASDRQDTPDAATPRAGAARAGAAKRAQVLAYGRNINAGELIAASDLVWSSDVVAGPDAPTDADQAIGKSAKRPLRLGAAVAAHDLGAARVIKRDEVVEVAFEDGGISLVLQAKALGDAGVGDLVQLMNPGSKKTLEAVASGPGRAVVGPAADALKSAPFGQALRLAAR